MRSEVDVLTLTATPIPRTLHMALAGIRDMSTIETPPEERLPIKTYVAEFDDQLVREAIARELERGGQVFFVHNRVHNIELIARAAARASCRRRRSASATARWTRTSSSASMLDFADGEADVLVCTTIIESGLDIPNVNTIIINQADKFGLAQLYQLRGRVGRGAARAYAYLLYEKHRALSEAAQQRLQAIFEATELGAGFQIALRDLEIRGAGNLLGAEQSGHIGAVGFDLYVKLLAEAVERLKALARGEPPPPSKHRSRRSSIDLPLAAYIPESYIGDLNLRLALYQRMAAVDVTCSANGSQPPSAVESPRNGRGPVRAPGATPQRNSNATSPTASARHPPPSATSSTSSACVRSRREPACSPSRARTAPAAAPSSPSASGQRRLPRESAPSARRDIERTGAVSIGHQQIRIDVEAAGDAWREIIEQVLLGAARTGAVPA